MGPKRTVEQLLPFLLGIYVKELKLYVAFDENNEEALSTIATQLGNFVEVFHWVSWFGMVVCRGSRERTEIVTCFREVSLFR